MCSISTCASSRTQRRGINIQSVAQGKRGLVGTAMDLFRLYGFGYFQWKLRRFICRKIAAKVFNEWLGSTRTCYSVKAVAKKYGVPVTEAVNVNSDAFLSHLREEQVEFIVSISGTQFLWQETSRPNGQWHCELPRGAASEVSRIDAEFLDARQWRDGRWHQRALRQREDR